MTIVPAMGRIQSRQSWDEKDMRGGTKRHVDSQGNLYLNHHDDVRS